MPEPKAFLGGFGFYHGAQIAGYSLDSVTSTHESISRYHEYRYAIMLVFRSTGSGQYENLFMAVNNSIGQEHVINSQYGNPYRCIIDAINYGDVMEDGNGVITFKLTGHSYRIK